MRSFLERLLPRPDEAAARWGFALAVLGSLLLFGGAFAWTVPWLLALVASAALAAQLTTRGRGARRLQHPVLLVTATATLVSSLQLVPLPDVVGALLGLERAEDVRATRALLGLGDGWLPLTRDPGGTRTATMAGAAATCAALTSATLARGRARSRLIALLTAAIGLTACVHVVHGVLDADAVYGVHTPRFTSPGALGPLMNRNHQAAVAALGATLALGLAFDARTEPRPRWLTLAGLLSLAALATQSRGGVLSLALGPGGVLLWQAVRGDVANRSRHGAALGGLALAAALSGAHPAIRAFFAEGGFDKLVVAADSLSLFREGPLLGVGRGAFSVAYAASASDALRFTHPENVVVQWAVELGIVGLALLTFAARFVGLAWLRARSATEAAMASALLALGAHDLFDFSLEMAGVGVLAAAIAGALPHRDRLPERRGRRATKDVVGAASFVVACAAALVLALPPRYDRTQGPVDGAVATGLLRAHPLEPELALAVAAAKIEAGEPDAGRWLNHSQRLAARWAAPHLLTARWLSRLGARDQAWLELGIAESKVAGASVRAACSLVAGGWSPTGVLRLVPVDATFTEESRILLERIRRCLSADDALRVDELRVERGDVVAIERLAQRALAAGDDTRAEALLDYAPPRALPILRAGVLVRSGRSDAALALLPPEARDVAALRVKARAHAQRGEDEVLQRLLRRLRGLSAEDVYTRSDQLRFEAELAEASGEIGRALRLAVRAAEVHPAEGDAHTRRLLRSLRQRTNEGRSVRNRPTREASTGADRLQTQPAPGMSGIR